MAAIRGAAVVPVRSGYLHPPVSGDPSQKARTTRAGRHVEGMHVEAQVGNPNSRAPIDKQCITTLGVEL